MTGKNWLTVLMLVAGVPIAAVGLARGNLLMALAGLVLLLVFIYLVFQAITSANKPETPIKPSANAAWNLKDQPVGGDAPGVSKDNQDKAQ
jgi:hypothetical protein